MTTKHTPGPWRLEIGSLKAHVEGGDGIESTITEVAICNAEDDNGSAIRAMEANARLIAAAPELLAALRAAERELNISAQTEPQASIALQTVRAAIAKAGVQS